MQARTGVLRPGVVCARSASILETCVGRVVIDPISYRGSDRREIMNYHPWTRGKLGSAVGAV